MPESDSDFYEAFAAPAEAWLRADAAAAHDALKKDPSRRISAEGVRAHFEDKWVARR